MEAWLLFDETLTLPGICAMVVTVFGVYLVTKKQAAAPKSLVIPNAQSNQ
jgi:drug/metabolite transporter (DMT)-like permease